LTSISKNLSLMLARDEIMVNVVSPGSIASEALRRENVMRVLAALPRREREVIEMRYGIVGGRSRTLEEVGRAFGFLVHDVARLFGRRFNQRALLFLGLTRAQCKVLGYLARNEGINQAGLADLLEIKPMTLVRQIDRMEEDGWIERQPQPGDRRA